MDDLELRLARGGVDGHNVFLLSEELAKECKHENRIQWMTEVTYVLQDLGAALSLGDRHSGHTITDRDELSIVVLEAGGDVVFDRLLGLFLDEAGSEGTNELVEDVALRVTDGELEGVNLDVNVLDFEDGSLVIVGRNEVYSRLEVLLV